MQRVQLRWPLPSTPPSSGSLVEQGLVLVLMRQLTAAQANAVVVALKGAYEDWNEVRVCQVQELVTSMRAGWKTPAITDEALRQAVVTAREYLQEIFQRTHGLDLAEFSDDPTAAGKVLPLMPFLGMATGTYLLWVATGGQMVVHPALVRVLDRLGIVPRSGSSKKTRELVDPVVPEGKGLEFLLAFAEVADRWCDARKPLCHECVLVVECKYGKKAFKEYQVQRARMEAQRKKDEARRAIVEKKESARRAREDERAKKKAEAEAQKQARELDRKRKTAERGAQRAKEESEKRAAAGRKAQPKKPDSKSAPRREGKPAAPKSAPVKSVKKADPKKPAGLIPRKSADSAAAAKKPSTPPRKPIRR